METLTALPTLSAAALVGWVVMMLAAVVADEMEGGA